MFSSSESLDSTLLTMSRRPRGAYTKNSHIPDCGMPKSPRRILTGELSGLYDHELTHKNFINPGSTICMQT
jgi:hypothetical protein